jgi:hypothetical protein
MTGVSLALSCREAYLDSRTGSGGRIGDAREKRPIQAGREPLSFWKSAFVVVF